MTIHLFLSKDLNSKYQLKHLTIQRYFCVEGHRMGTNVEMCF